MSEAGTSAKRYTSDAITVTFDGAALYPRRRMRARAARCL